MNIKTVMVGKLEENCYVLEKEGYSIIIDPGDEYKKIKKEIEGTITDAILITHHHFDHVGALKYFSSIPIYDYANLKEQTYQIGPFSFRVLATPGHSSDSISFFFEKENKMFVGDFIFFESIGRTDLPTGSREEMKKSILKLLSYPVSCTLYPGHGKCTTLEHEIKWNPFF